MEENCPLHFPQEMLDIFAEISRQQKPLLPQHYQHRNREHGEQGGHEGDFAHQGGVAAIAQTEYGAKVATGMAMTTVGLRLGEQA